MSVIQWLKNLLVRVLPLRGTFEGFAKPFLKTTVIQKITIQLTEGFLGGWKELRDDIDDAFNHVSKIVDNSGSVCLNRS